MHRRMPVRPKPRSTAPLRDTKALRRARAALANEVPDAGDPVEMGSADGTARRVAMPAPPCQHACSVLIIRSHNHLCTVGAGRSAARMWINRDRRDEIRQLNSLSLNSCSVTVVAGRRASVPISIWCPCVSLPNACGHHEQLTVLKTLSYPRTHAH